jgi:flagellar hook-basal body complex protein FliE
MPGLLTDVSLASMGNPIFVGGKLAGNVAAAPKAEPAGSPFVDFGSVLSDAIANLDELNAVKDADSYNLSIGDMDNLAQMMINSQRADAAMSMVVELRNKLLEGYQEIMRTSI